MISFAAPWVSGRRLHADRRKLAPAFRRPDRIYDPPAADGRLVNAQRAPRSNVARSERSRTGNEAPPRGCHMQ
jgi:hypothetical protein